MPTKKEDIVIIPNRNIVKKSFVIREQKLMLDFDLVALWSRNETAE